MYNTYIYIYIHVQQVLGINLFPFVFDAATYRVTPFVLQKEKGTPRPSCSMSLPLDMANDH